MPQEKMAGELTKRNDGFLTVDLHLSEMSIAWKELYAIARAVNTWALCGSTENPHPL